MSPQKLGPKRRRIDKPARGKEGKFKVSWMWPRQFVVCVWGCLPLALVADGLADRQRGTLPLPLEHISHYSFSLELWPIIGSH
jgi:hypothetical protein